MRKNTILTLVITLLLLLSMTLSVQATTAKIIKINNVIIHKDVGEDIKLPKTVIAVYSNGVKKQMPITWGKVAFGKWDSGKFYVKGTVKGYNKPVYAIVYSYCFNNFYFGMSQIEAKQVLNELKKEGIINKIEVNCDNDIMYVYNKDNLEIFNLFFRNNKLVSITYSNYSRQIKNGDDVEENPLPYYVITLNEYKEIIADEKLQYGTNCKTYFIVYSNFQLYVPFEKQSLEGKISLDEEAYYFYNKDGVKITEWDKGTWYYRVKLGWDKYNNRVCIDYEYEKKE